MHATVIVLGSIAVGVLFGLWLLAGPVGKKMDKK